MKRLRHFEAPAFIWSQGVRDRYEGWIQNPKLYGKDNTVCVVFTDLPPGLKPAEELDVPVSVEGYFFKIYRYQTTGSWWRDSPLVIAHTLVLDQQPSTA